MNYKIRKIVKKECFDITHIETLAWNETYKGIVPDEFLNNLYNNEDERTKRRLDNYEKSEKNQYVLEINNMIVGYVHFGPTEEKDIPNCGEIYGLYILNEYKGNGFGRKLVETGIKELKSMGYDKMVIGCLDGNKSNDFYKHLGGKYIRTRIFEKLQLPENIYYYDI